jgi:hypothetical protein
MATSATTSVSSSQILSINPYENHPSLTQLEADVLWEYAKLNQHIKDVRFSHTRHSERWILLDQARFFSPLIAVGCPNTLFERNSR